LQMTQHRFSSYTSSCIAFALLRDNRHR